MRWKNALPYISRSPGWAKGGWKEGIATIQYRKKAVKYIDGLTADEKKRIKAGIEGLAEIPPRGDIKRLLGMNDGSLHLRIGGFRVIYRKIGEDIVIDRIDTRGDVYK